MGASCDWNETHVTESELRNAGTACFDVDCRHLHDFLYFMSVSKRSYTPGGKLRA